MIRSSHEGFDRREQFHWALFTAEDLIFPLGVASQKPPRLAAPVFIRQLCHGIPCGRCRPPVLGKEGGLRYCSRRSKRGIYS